MRLWIWEKCTGIKSELNMVILYPFLLCEKLREPLEDVLDHEELGVVQNKS